MKFILKDFFSNLNESEKHGRISWRSLKKVLVERFIFCAVTFGKTAGYEPEMWAYEYTRNKFE